MFKNLKLGRKIALGFSLIILLTIIAGSLAALRTGRVLQDARLIKDEQMPQVSAATQLAERTHDAMIHAQVYSLTGEPQELAKAEESLRAISESLGKVGGLAHRAEGTQGLPAIVQQARERRDKYAEELKATAEAMKTFRNEMGSLDNESRSYKQNAEAFLEAQLEDLKRSIADGAKPEQVELQRQKIAMAAELVSLGQEMRVAGFKSYATRDRQVIEASQKLFDRVFQLIGKLKAVIPSTDMAQLAQLGTMQMASRSYRDTLGHSAESLDNLRKLDVRRQEQAGLLVDSAQTLTTKSVGFVRMSSDRTVDALLNASSWIIGGLVAQVLAAGLIGWRITRAIARPVGKIVKVVEAMEKGDLTQRAEVHQTDELGQLASALNRTCERLRDLMKELSQNANVLAASSEELISTSNQMASGAEEVNAQSTAVAGAGEQLSTNVQAMAMMAEQISTCAGSVAAGVDEMKASINEVSQSCAKESAIAQRANTQAKETREIMARLGDSAREINKIVDIISNIADQTNLLALNATIEAASAGEAGRGFSVVANEVKELARQSAQATEQISRQIDQVKVNTDRSVKAIDEIARVIEEISQIAGSIAAAVEQQTATTKEIASSMAEVSDSSKDVAANIQQMAGGATEVSRNIHGINTVAQLTAAGASETNASAQELAKIAAHLKKIVDRFKL